MEDRLAIGIRDAGQGRRDNDIGMRMTENRKTMTVG